MVAQGLVALQTSSAPFAAVIQNKLNQHGRARAAILALRFLVPLGIGAATALIIAVSLLVGDKPAGADAEQLRLALGDADGLLINAGSAPIVFAAFFGLVSQAEWWDLDWEAYYSTARETAPEWTSWLQSGVT